MAQINIRKIVGPTLGCQSGNLAKGRRAPRVGLHGGRNRHYTLAEKFAARITIAGPDECWDVAGHGSNTSGHVHIGSGSWAAGTFTQIYAHVFAWEQANGRKVPDGQVVMHSCDRPCCANPSHLKLGTQRDNIIDSIHKGRYNCFGRQKLNADQVQDIRAMALLGIMHKDIAKQFGIARNTVSGILSGATWRHLPVLSK